MAKITDLPIEIILIILKSKTISFTDVENFSSTCKAFQWISHYKNLWKEKYAQRWPTAQLFCKDEMGIEFNDVSIDDLKEGIKCVEDLWLHVSRMPEKYYCRKKYKDAKRSFNLRIKKHPLNLFILFDELTRNIYHQDLRQCNLTKRFYTIKIFNKLYKDMSSSYWKKMVKKPNEVQRLEDILVAILRWCYPEKLLYITILHVDKFIDNIVQKVLKFLKDENLQHPILSISPEQFSIWKNNRIEKNFWCENDAISIKNVLDEIIVSSNFYESWMQPNRVYADTVSSRMQLSYRHILWLIIYICVTNRLGLHVINVLTYQHNYCSDMQLVWQPRNCIESTEYFTFEWTFNLNNVKLSDIRICQPFQESYESFLPSWKKLMTIIDSELMTVIMEICNVWLRNRFPFNEQNITSNTFYYNKTICIASETFRKKRSPNLKYAIGMIVTHKHIGHINTHTNITGVIVGWHNKSHIQRWPYKEKYCTSNYIKQECIQKYNIEDWELQPYYVLLVQNNLCYVPQCAITSTCEKWIYNPKIGKYFCKFEGTHYVPNERLEKHYPDDAAVVREILSSRK